MIHKYLLPGKATLLRDFIFAADDGLLTTFAVVAGSTGASFSKSIILTLGFANVFADGIIVATGIYLGIKGELESIRRGDCLQKSEGAPLGHGLITFISFVLFGLLPLLPFLFLQKDEFMFSTVIVALGLFSIGALKTIYTQKNLLRSGLTMLIIGGISAIMAFLVGFLSDKYVV